MKYRHCIFDLYGTLVDIHTDEDSPALWRSMAGWYSQQGALYRPEELHSAYLRAAARAGGSAGGDEAYPEIRLELVFRQLFQERGVPADMEQAMQAGRRFRELSTEYIRLYSGARELLGALRERGCGVWLLSNAQSIFTSWELERLGVAECFDGIYLSSDCGVKKPDRRFFQTLLRERHIAPDTAVMIGNDGVCDIQGGRAVGLDTFYIRSNLSPCGPEPDADYVLDQIDLDRVRRILLEE